MVKKRREEARFAEMHDLGRRNVETLAAARQWCKHIHVEMTSSGLLAETSGLPIGSHDVTCPHAERGIGGMNLPMILPQFVIQNCRGCTSHAPNGNTEWGERVIAEYEANVKQAEERRSSLAAQVEQVRASKRALARDAQNQADFTVHHVLELAEALFDEDVQKRSEASLLLCQAAKIGPELFDPAAVDLILTPSPERSVAELCLPIAAGLAGRRHDLTDRLVSVSVQAICAGFCVETACEILLGCGCGATRPIPAEVIKRVVLSQNHMRPIGGWPTRRPDCPLVDVPPTYGFSTSLLVRAYDQNPDAVLAPLRAGLRKNDKYRRINVCGVVKELLKQRPLIGVELLPGIVDSLDLDDDPYNESADGKACSLIGRIFFGDPDRTDQFLHERFGRQSQEARCLTAHVYKWVLRAEWDEQYGLERSRFDETIWVALGRCLSLMQDQGLDVEVRQEFADAVESACRHHADTVMAEFDTLLGTLACVCAQKEPPAPPPRIILPGDPRPDPLMQGLEQESRRMTWGHFKTKIAKCLEELVGKRPQLAVKPLTSCFSSLDSKTHEAFKAKIVRLLGELGSNRELLPQVLPLVWQALMDYDSVLVRCYGIDAVSRCFESRECDPPANIIEILLLHLKDTFVLIHQAVIRAIRWKTRWFTPTQAETAIQLLGGWAATYRQKNCFQLEDICRAILSLSRSVPAMRYSAIRFITDLLPTGEALVDGALIGLLTDSVETDEDGAFCVTPAAAAWLARQLPDPFDHYDRMRDEVYDWLSALPEETFQEARTALVTAGRTIAQSGDAWSTCRFAAIFAAFGDFQAEAYLLALAKSSLPEGRRNQKVVESLDDLEQAAKANAQLAGKQ